MTLPPHRRLLWLFVTILALNICAVAFYQTVTYQLLFHSDSAIKNLFAEEVLTSGSLLPPDWYFGNGDIWLIFSHLLIVPLLTFMENSFTAHAVAGLLFDLLLLFAAAYWMARVHFPGLVKVALLATLFTGISPYVAESLFGQVSLGYAWGLLFLFLLLGAVTPALMTSGLTKNKDSTWNRIRLINTLKKLRIEWPHLLIASSVTLSLALMGMRGMFSIFVPFTLACGLLWVIWFVTSPQRSTPLPLVQGIQPSRLLIIPASLLLLYLVGFAVHKAWIIPRISYIDISSHTLIDGYANTVKHLQLLIEGYLLAAGVSFDPNLHPYPGKPLTSIFGASLIFRLCWFSILFLLPWWGLRHITKLTQDDRPLALLILIYCSSFILTFVFFVFSTNLAAGIGAIRYFAIHQILAAMIAVLFIARWGRQYPRLWILYAGILLLWSAINSLHYVRDGIQKTPNQGWALQEQHRLTPLINTLKQEQLTYGYASFWHSGVSTVLSGGQVRISAVSFGHNGAVPFRVLASENWYRPTSHQGRSFIVLANAEVPVNRDFIANVHGAPKQIIAVTGFEIWVYDHNPMLDNYTH